MSSNTRRRAWVPIEVRLFRFAEDYALILDSDLQSELTPDYGKDDSAEIRSAEKTLQGPKASTALVRRRHDVLQTMCKVRGIECEDSTRKEVLSERLRAWVSPPN